MNLRKTHTFDKIIFLVALVWYFLTAWFSTGYYHADEHYQIVEFAAFKEGKVSANSLPWEFRSQIRPATQVSIACVIFEAAEKAGLNDPYAEAFILRLITALLAVSAIWFFTKHFSRMIRPGYRKLFLILSFFIWFLPFLNVRFSSETWAGLIFLPVLALADKEEKKLKDFVLIGLLAGLSFLFRYQMAIAVTGVLFWLLIIKKEKVSGLLAMAASGIMVVIIGTLIDDWFYGEFVFVPWNYVKLNLLAGKAAEFGTSPWYTYFYYVFRFAFFPIGMVIILSFLFLVFKKPRSVIVWAVVPFVLIHSLIPHKELRFLFPMINLVPVMIVYALQEIKWQKMSTGWRKAILAAGVLLGLINLTALVVASVKPAGFGREETARQIWQIKDNESVNLICFEGSNPYDPWGGMVAGFYLPAGVHFERIDTLEEINRGLLKDGERNLLVLKAQDVQDSEVAKRISAVGFHKTGQSIPQWLMPFLKIYGGFHTEKVLYLYDSGSFSAGQAGQLGQSGMLHGSP